MATTIHNLELSFEVQDESDEARFAKLFEKHFNGCKREEAETKARECRLDAEMSLIGRKEDHHS